MEDATLGKELLNTDPSIAPRQKLNDLTLECLGNDDDFNITSSSNGSDSTAAGMPRSSSVTGFGTILQQIRRAENLASQNRPTEALELLRPVLAKRSRDPDILCLQAICFAASGNKPQALAAFAGALAADPTHLRALLGCAALHKDSGLLHEAKDFLEKAHSIASKHINRRRTETNKEEEEEANGNREKDDDDDDDDGSGSDSSSQQHEQEQQSTLLQAEATQLNEQITQAFAMVLTDFGTQLKGANSPGWKGYYEQALAVAPDWLLCCPLQPWCCCCRTWRY
jgi:tetratricopeptide (TPR) repeat protein